MVEYFNTSTVKATTKCYKNTFPSDMIFTKSRASISDEQVEKLTREFNVQYRICIVSLIYLLYTIVDLSFSVQNLAKFSLNPGKVNLTDWYIC